MWIVVAVVAVAVLTGCARAGGTTPGAAPDEVEAAFAERAEQAAARWQESVGPAWKAGFVPVEPLTIWSASIDTDTAKQAAGNGWYELSTALPESAGRAVVRFPDGQNMDVPVVSGRAAFDALKPVGAQPCDGCVELVVTGAKLTTAKLMTSRGSAAVPAWAFTIRGLQEPMVRVAVAPEAISSMPAVPALPDLPQPDRSTILPAAKVRAVVGDRIDYAIGGGACDENPASLRWESDQVIVLGGRVSPPADDRVCTLQMVDLPVSATLRRPVGDRIILDVVSGQPVPLFPGQS